MKKILIFAALAATLFCACEKDENVESNIDKTIVDDTIINNDKHVNDDNNTEEPEEKVDTNPTEMPETGANVFASFVQSYINNAEFLHISLNPTTGKCAILALEIDGKGLVFSGSAFTEENIEKSETNKSFYEISKSHNDTSYNSIQVPYTNKIFTESISKIEIISNKDLLGIKAGQSLESKCQIYTASPWKFINGGYKTLSEKIELNENIYFNQSEYEVCHFALPLPDGTNIQDVSSLLFLTIEGVSESDINGHELTISLTIDDKVITAKKEIIM